MRSCKFFQRTFKHYFPAKIWLFQSETKAYNKDVLPQRDAFCWESLSHEFRQAHLHASRKTAVKKNILQNNLLAHKMCVNLRQTLFSHVTRYGRVPAVPESRHSLKPGSQVRAKSVIGNTLQQCPNSTLSKCDHYLFVFMDHLDAMWETQMFFPVQYHAGAKAHKAFPVRTKSNPAGLYFTWRNFQMDAHHKPKEGTSRTRKIKIVPRNLGS